MALNVKQVEAKARAGTPGRYAVGEGLYLQVDGPGRVSWLYRFQLAGKPRAMGLGSFRDVTLAEARRRAAEARALSRGGVDPLHAREAKAKAALAAAAAPSVPTFKQAADEFIAAQGAGWSNAKHAAQWTSTLAAYAYPQIGALLVDAITTDHVLTVLKPIWTAKPETASRVRGRIEAVLDAAKVRGWRQGENPARWKGHLSLLLPAKGKVARVEHHAALDWREIGLFWPALAQKLGAAATALRFAILTVARSSEVRHMTWGEVDLSAKLWAVPASRMKGRREHRIPLSDAAVSVLSEARAAWVTKHAEEPGPDAPVFAAPGGGMLSDMALTMLLRKMRQADGTGWTDAAGEPITAHGFRSTFRDWAGEATAHPREVIEQALAHQLPNKAEAAYARGDLLTKRTCSSPVLVGAGRQASTERLT